MLVPFVAPRLVDVLALGERASEAVALTLEAPDCSLAMTRGLRTAAGGPEEALGERRAWSSQHLATANEPARLHYRLRLSRDQRRLQHALDDKLVARRILAAEEIPLPRWLHVDDPSREHDSVARRLGTPYVLQSRWGSGGSGTWLVGGPADAALRPRLRGGYLASEMIEGPVLNCHAFLEDGQILISAASVQVTGQSTRGADPAAYCGADFGAFSHLDQGLAEEFVSGAARIGASLRALDWRGLLGVDAIGGPGGVRFLELNPRYQASTWLLAEAEAAHDLTPLGELEARRDPDATPRHGPARTVYREPLEAGTLTVRARLGGRFTAPVRLCGGSYAWDPVGTLQRVSPEFRLTSLRAEEVLVEGAPGSFVSRASRGATLARLTTRRTVLDSAGQLNRWGQQLDASLRDLLPPIRPWRAGVPSDRA